MKTDLSVISYPIAETEITKKREKYSSLKIGGVNDKDGYRMVKAARIDMKNDRVAVENRRKELKAGALEFGREVDKQAKRLKEMISEVEDKLKSEEDAYQDAIDKIKREEEERKRAKLNARIEKLQAVDAPANPMIVMQLTDEEFEQELAKATEAKRIADEEAERTRKEEEERLAKEAAERKAEEERLEKERKEIEEQRKKQEEEQRKIEEQRRAIEEEKARIAREEELKREREEAARKARIEAEGNAKRQAEEKAAKEKAAEEEAKRLESMRPDTEKLLGIADSVESLIGSVKVSVAAEPIAHAINKRLNGCASQIRRAVEEYAQGKPPAA